jgi:hypothetical protein
VSFQAEGISPTGHGHHVARSFALSSRRLNAADPIDDGGLAVLAGAARFAPISAAAARSAESEISAAASGRQFGKAVRRLSELGLLEQGADGVLRMHR